MNFDQLSPPGFHYIVPFLKIYETSHALSSLTLYIYIDRKYKHTIPACHP